MLKQNGHLQNQLPLKFMGGGTISGNRANFGRSDRLAWFCGDNTEDNKGGFPYGYRAPGAWLLGLKAGAMSSYGTLFGDGEITPFTMAAGLNADAALDGSGDITAATAQLVISMVATIAGTGTVSAADLRGYLNAVASISGSGGITNAAAGALAWADAALSGSGTITNATPYATGVLAATIRGYSDLTPEGIADKVWAALAAANNAPGSMGELLNSAGAAADPLLGVVEGTLTLRDVQRIVLAVLAGQVTGAGTGTETFKGQAGESRVVSVVDNDGNRSSVTLDAA